MLGRGGASMLEWVTTHRIRAIPVTPQRYKRPPNFVLGTPPARPAALQRAGRRRGSTSPKPSAARCDPKPYLGVAALLPSSGACALGSGLHEHCWGTLYDCAIQRARPGGLRPLSGCAAAEERTMDWRRVKVPCWFEPQQQILVPLEIIY